MKIYKDYIELFDGKKHRILKTIPKGWRKIIGATTAPCGYAWITNNKSMFSLGKKYAFIKL